MVTAKWEVIVEMHTISDDKGLYVATCSNRYVSFWCTVAMHLYQERLAAPSATGAAAASRGTRRPWEARGGCNVPMVANAALVFKVSTLKVVTKETEMIKRYNNTILTISSSFVPMIKLPFKLLPSVVLTSLFQMLSFLRLFILGFNKTFQSCS